MLFRYQFKEGLPKVAPKTLSVIQAIRDYQAIDSDIAVLLLLTSASLTLGVSLPRKKLNCVIKVVNSNTDI